MKYILLVKQTIQIIGGKYRKKKINFPDIANLRPTASRIRETVFNWLMHDIRGAKCLDGFAGSGALGFEAISRGAAEVTLIEKHPKIYRSLLNSKANFTEEKIEVLNTDLENFLQKNTKSFDIVFLDPPFNLPFPMQCLDYLAKSNTLNANGLVYIEYKNMLDLNPDRWECRKHKSTGQISYCLYQKKAP